MATRFLLRQMVSMRGPTTGRVASRLSTRAITSKSMNLAAPASTMMAQTIMIEFGALNKASTERKVPASGWRKNIVKSTFATSMAEAPLPSSSLDDEISMDRAEIERTARDQGLKLKVDVEALQNLAEMRCTPLSLKDMYKYAVDFNNQEQRLRNAQFLHKELPIRIAQRAVDLLTLPHGLSDILEIRQVANVYLLYLEKFQEFPVPTTPEKEDRFTDLLQSMVLDRSSIPNTIAQGVDTWLRRNDNVEDNVLKEMEEALYRFFTARVGLRFLTEHHVLSSPDRSKGKKLRKVQSPFYDDQDEFLGCIETNCCPAKEVRKVVESVARQTKEYYGICPEIQVVSAKQNKETKFTYVPHHLHYMVGELVKNSCRATVERHLKSENSSNEAAMPPIRVVIVKGKEDVTIKVCDRGGGIPRSKISTIFKFAHSTAGEEESGSEFGVDEVTGSKIRGFGLPLARIYARYLGGELTLKSMEGYGLDAYLHLPRLGDSCENLPLPVKFSPGELNSNPPKRAVLS